MIFREVPALGARLNCQDLLILLSTSFIYIIEVAHYFCILFAIMTVLQSGYMSFKLHDSSVFEHEFTVGSQFCDLFAGFHSNF